MEATDEQNARATCVAVYDTDSGMGVAFHVRNKGPKDQLSVVLAAVFIDSLGLQHPILQTDGEPAIKAWARA
eukprot:8679624-Alexandrium_andersonii.AAC.1